MKTARCMGLMVLVVAAPALAASDPESCLDPTFADGGLFRLDVGGRENVGWSAQGIDRQNDKWVVGGVGGTPARALFLVLRLDDRGALDPAFGDAGVVEVDVGPDDQELESVRVLPDGSLVLGGAVASGVGPGIQQIGVVRLRADGRGAQSSLPGFLPAPQLINGIVPLADGGVLLAGQGRTRGADFNLFVVQVDPDGGLSPGFGNGGIMDIDFAGSDEFGAAITVDQRGNVLVPGVTYSPTPDFGLARLTPGGQLDSTFGDAGRVTVDFFGRIDQCAVAAAQADGKPLCAGPVDLPGGGRRVAIVRFTTAGALDPDFADGGVALFDFGPGSALRALVVREEDQLIVAGGSARNDAGTLDSLVLWLQSNGRVAFNGLWRHNSSGRDEVVHTLRYDERGRLLVFGELGAAGGNDIGVARLTRCTVAEPEPLPAVQRRVATVGCACSESGGLALVLAGLALMRRRARPAD